MKRVHAFALGLGALLIVTAGCRDGGDSTEPHGPIAAAPNGYVTTAGTQFLDPAGRPLILHGVNVVCKSREEGYVGDITPADFALIRSWGMNCVRLGIFWDGLEPTPGKLDEAYLDRVARLIGWAAAEGLYIVLDMHQDLYSVKFSDGAPAWATLDEGKPHTKGAVWSDAYYTSEAVQTALDHFWANSPSPAGVGLQEHYARAWRRVAERFKEERSVVGFDLMNEPFPGKDGGKLLLTLMARLAQELSARPGSSVIQLEELAAMQGTAEGRKQITSWLGDLDLYQRMLEAGTPLMQEFERNRLQPFYQRVARAIREVNPHHILFLCPSMSANLGIPSALEPLRGAPGRRDPLQAYAPHGYDIVVDTPLQDLTSQARVKLIFNRHAEFAQRHQLPMWVGEWGAYYLDPRAAEAARQVVQLFETHGCGDAYWHYSRALTNSPLLPALSRGKAETRR
jgi:endoglycosylceramidase